LSNLLVIAIGCRPPNTGASDKPQRCEERREEEYKLASAKKIFQKCDLRQLTAENAEKNKLVSSKRIFTEIRQLLQSHHCEENRESVQIIFSGVFMLSAVYLVFSEGKMLAILARPFGKLFMPLSYFRTVLCRGLLKSTQV